jgi:iron complex outermembrane receptor protein
MRIRAWIFFLLSAPAVFGQLPAAEDLETKAKRELIRDGLEMREVRESSAKDVGEALSKIEGLSKLRKGAIANDVLIRGFHGANVNLLIDGVRIYGACPGQMDPAAFHVDFAEVDRIEVTKGGFDMTNQGSLGGAVQVIRKRGSPGFRLSPSFSTGSFGFFNPAVHASLGNDRIEWTGGYSFRRSLPFLDGNGARMTEQGGYLPAWRNDEAFRIHTGWTGIRFSPARNQNAELGYTHQSGANVLYPYLQMDSPYDIADRLHANYEWRDLPGAIERIKIQSYYTTVRHWMTDEKRSTSVGALDLFSMATFARTRTGGGRLDLSLKQGFRTGAEIYQRNWNAVNSMRSRMMVADRAVIPNVNSTVAGGYLDWGRSLTDRLHLSAGARLDTANIYLRDFGAGLTLYQAYHGVAPTARRDTMPSANFRATFGLTESLELFTGIGTTVRFPDAQERFFQQRRASTDWVGNPNINPARNTESNAGLSFRNRKLYAKALAFYSRLDDYSIVYDQPRIQAFPDVRNTLARSYRNVDARMYGGEFSYGWFLSSRWIWNGGLAYTRAAKDPIPAAGIFSPYLPEIPPLKGRSALRYGTRTWFVEGEGVAANAQRRVDTDLNETPTAGYAVLNLKVGWHLKKWVLTAGIDNVFDRYYREHLSFQRDPFRSGVRLPEPGRNLFVNLGYSF